MLVTSTNTSMATSRLVFDQTAGYHCLDKLTQKSTIRRPVGPELPWCQSPLLPRCLPVSPHHLGSWTWRGQSSCAWWEQDTGLPEELLGSLVAAAGRASFCSALFPSCMEWGPTDPMQRGARSCQTLVPTREYSKPYFIPECRTVGVGAAPGFSLLDPHPPRPPD